MQSADHGTVAVVQAPRVAEDKTALTALQAFRSLAPLPLSSGHKSLSVIVVMADRALLSAADRRVQQYLAVEAMSMEDSLGVEALSADAAGRFYLASG